jgi:hypothetical protein
MLFGKEYLAYRYVVGSTVYVTKIHVVMFPTFTEKIIRFGNYSASEDGDVHIYQYSLSSSFLMADIPMCCLIKTHKISVKTHNIF